MHLFVASALALLGQSRMDLSAIGDSWSRFDKYVERFGKSYKDDAEKKHRFGAFLASEEEILALNAMEGDAKFGWTKFSDMTKEEFKKHYLTFQPYDKERRATLHGEIAVTKPVNLTTSSSWDWRDHNGVTAVKDQGNCGSCWAFSATESVESAYLLTYNADPDTFVLAEQELVSCDTTDGGCNGGDLPYAFDYIETAGGIATESSYPYVSGSTGSSETCKSFTVQANTKPKSYSYATPGCYGSCNSQDESTLAANLEAVGPVGICVNAANWQNYNSGVMSSSTCGSHNYYELDHCVQLVGFNGIDGSDGYWLVRNSWASDWGEAGYIFVSYGDNTCGVADEAMFVQL